MPSCFMCDMFYTTCRYVPLLLATLCSEKKWDP